MKRQLALTFLAFAAVSTVLAAQAWRPACDETRTGQYTFDGLNGSVPRPVHIYVCPDVHCASKSEFATVTKDSYSAPMPRDLARPYFLIERQEPGHAFEKRIIAARRLALEGAYNFRDLGGMETADGKWIRWGQVFRSDQLAKLTSADYKRLNAIGISLVCDLRSEVERKSDPDKWQNGSPVFLLASIGESDKQEENIHPLAAFEDVSRSIEERKALFEQSYVDVTLNSAERFGAVIRTIASWDRPSVLHCAAGRDRTGMTAALLLRTLGVPHEAIVSDFLLSTRYLDEAPAEPTPASEAEARQLRELLEVLQLQPRYIEAMFKTIDERFGSFDKYRREAMHVSDTDVARLKARLLE
jgi:protein-tyrosine phosphatase